MAAFYELTTCRGGMGGPIPWTAIVQYAQWAGWTGELFDDAVFYIRALDSVVLEREEAKTKN